MAVIMDAKEAARKIHNGDKVLIGGFYGHGAPHQMIDALIEQGQRDLILYANSGNTKEFGAGRLVASGQVKKFICTWCGRLPLAGELADAGKLDLEICPQGTWVERIRAGGFGLGGVLSSTGLGTMIEERWAQRITLNGKDWLYHDPIRGNVALVEAYRADTAGNLMFHLTQRAFSVYMCYAADLVIVEVQNPIEAAGSLDPEQIHVSGVTVDILVPQKGVEG